MWNSIEEKSKAVASGNYLVEIMADSFVLLNGRNHRITTFRIRMPRMILAEFNTHRWLSRSSASFRAIKASVMRQKVLQMPFVPERFPKTHKGMQASAWVEKGTIKYSFLSLAWSVATYIVVGISAVLDWLGISKQLANRFLEAVSWHDTLVTATEWDNFIALRADEAAQDEIRIVAELVLEALNKFRPTQLQPGDWHLPFGDRIDGEKLEALFQKMVAEGDSLVTTKQDLLGIIVVARCARVSYANFKGPENYEDDVKLYKSLKEQGHWSAFEHIARAMTMNEYEAYTATGPGWVVKGRCGNFIGWVQARKVEPSLNEDRPEPRLLKIF